MVGEYGPGKPKGENAGNLFSFSKKVFYPIGPNSKDLRNGISNFGKIIIFVFGRVESTVGKGENAGYQHFLLLP